MKKNIISKKICTNIYDLIASGDIFGNRYIVVGKEIINNNDKVVMYFDLYTGGMYVITIYDFCALTKDMYMQFTKDIISIDYANKERGD